MMNGWYVKRCLIKRVIQITFLFCLSPSLVFVFGQGYFYLALEIYIRIMMIIDLCIGTNNKFVSLSHKEKTKIYFFQVLWLFV